MPNYDQLLLHGGLSPETIKSIAWLVVTGICLALTISLIVTVHLAVIKRYKELKKEDEPTSD